MPSFCKSSESSKESLFSEICEQEIRYMGVCMYMCTFSCEVFSLPFKYDTDLTRQMVSKGLKT